MRGVATAAARTVAALSSSSSSSSSADVLNISQLDVPLGAAETEDRRGRGLAPASCPALLSCDDENTAFTRAGAAEAGCKVRPVEKGCV